jgi:hypothetical protein
MSFYWSVAEFDSMQIKKSGCLLIKRHYCSLSVDWYHLDRRLIYRIAEFATLLVNSIR